VCNKNCLNRGSGVLVRVLFLTAAFALFPSCAARIQGDLKADGSGELTVAANLEPRMAALIRSLSGLANGSAAAPVVSGESITRSMAGAPGVKSAVFINTGPTAVTGSVSVSKIGDFLAPAASKKGFLDFTQAGTGGKLSITVDRETGPGILTLISPEISDYLAAIMAPLATGEELTKSAYVTLVSSIYGQGITDEISKGSVRADLSFPGTVNSVKGGTFSGKTASFSIPLLDILVLEEPLSYEVVWR
jgi:hypothetical protein